MATDRTRVIDLADGTTITLSHPEEQDHEEEGYPLEVTIETGQATVNASGTGSDLGELARSASWVAADPVTNPSNYDDGANVDTITRRPVSDGADRLVVTVEYYNPLIQAIVERHHFLFDEETETTLRYKGFTTEMCPREFTDRFHDGLAAAFTYLQNEAGWELRTPFDEDGLDEFQS